MPSRRSLSALLGEAALLPFSFPSYGGFIGGGVVVNLKMRDRWKETVGRKEDE